MFFYLALLGIIPFVTFAVIFSILVGIATLIHEINGRVKNE